MAIFNRNSLPYPFSECALRAGGGGVCCLGFLGWIPFGYHRDTILDTFAQIYFLNKTKGCVCLDTVDTIISNSYARECFFSINTRIKQEKKFSHARENLKKWYPLYPIKKKDKENKEL